MMKIALGAIVGIVDVALRPVGGILHVAWAVQGSLAWLQDLMSAL